MILRVLDLNIPPEPVGAAGVFNALITEVTNLPVRGDYFIKKDLTEYSCLKVWFGCSACPVVGGICDGLPNGTAN